MQTDKPCDQWTFSQSKMSRIFGLFLGAILTLSLGRAVGQLSPQQPAILEIDRDVTLDPKKTYGRIIIKASRITIDGQGAWLIGNPGGKPNTLTGTAIEAQGVSGVTLKNVNAKGWQTGLSVTQGKNWLIEGCNFSDNFHDPDFGWGEVSPRGGMVLTELTDSTIRQCKANNVWDGCALIRSSDNRIEDNDFSRTSNTCLKLWTSCRNRIVNNKLNHGIRKKPGEVHARDSTGVLLESGSNKNLLLKNEVTHGGDGLFIRSLNQWISTGNRIEGNDFSEANNNCVECWSPGNTFINNKANHGSYGFWMGGSDKSVLIGNEASYNGLASGNHNSPHLPSQGHAGIVFMFGTSTHVTARGNRCLGNNGAGIAILGDLDSQGKKWKARHWIVEQNTLNANRWGLYIQYADWINIAANRFEKNTIKEVQIEAGTTNIVQPAPQDSIQSPPQAKLKGPFVLRMGDTGHFDASESVDPAGKPLHFRWDLGDDTILDTARVQHTFASPGFYRVGMTVTNGLLSDLAWIDLYVLSREPELGTEGEARNWSWEDAGSRVLFQNDTETKLVGKSSLSAHINPYSGGRCNLVYSIPGSGISRNGKKHLTFWIRSQNDNPISWQDANPIITLTDTNKKTCRLTPTHDPLIKFVDSESREGWLRVVVPLDGDRNWKIEGDRITQLHSISLGFDSWGGNPIHIWLDGMSLES